MEASHACKCVQGDMMWNVDVDVREADSPQHSNQKKWIIPHFEYVWKHFYDGPWLSLLKSQSICDYESPFDKITTQTV